MLGSMVKSLRMVKTCLLVVCCLCLLTIPALAGDTADVWDGGIEKPTKLVEKDGVYYYEISTCEQLAYVAQTGGDWLTYNYLLVNDLILNETAPQWDEAGNCTNSEALRNWTPIANVLQNGFDGILDGGGHVVTGLYVESDAKFFYVGLIGTTEVEAVIRNLSLENVYVKGRSYAGSLVGEGYCDIINCSAIGNVISTNGTAGGLAGAGNGEITDCFAICNVTANSDAGGLVGYSRGKITNCYATGDVVATNGDAGGLVGNGFYCEIITCWAAGDVTAANSSAGGLIGVIKVSDLCSIENCYALGDVSASTYAGGLIGCYTTPYTGSAPNGIFNCYAAGTVLSGKNKGGFLGEDRRIWGENFIIKNCYFLRDEGVNEDLFGTSVATADVANQIEGKTLEQMKQQNTFAGWDFGTVWAMDSHRNDGLPYLWVREGESGVAPIPQYRINSIKPRDFSGTAQDTIPDENFLVTLSLTKLVEDGDALVLLAAYTDQGQYQGLMYVSVKGMSKNAELELTLPVDNQTGEIAKLTAFAVASFGDMTPLGEAVTFE